MEEEKRSNWRLRSGHYLGEISALCFLHLPSRFSSPPYLLAGSGSQMLLYDLEAGKLMESFQVFKGIRVHGITCSLNNSIQGNESFTIAVFGEKRVKLFNLLVVLRSQNQPEKLMSLTLIQSLPKFSHWVLDVLFLKNFVAYSNEGSQCLAVGCTDNSVHIWDISRSIVILVVQSPERCLLYSMRLWGDNLQALRVASGTIYNEVANLPDDRLFPA